MRKTVIATTGLLALMLAPAHAADVPSISVHDWTGAYIGLNAGYALGNQVQHDEGGDSGDQDMDGFAGGAQIGANYQMDAFVLGAEADFQFAGIDGNFNTQAGKWGCGPRDDCSTQIDWFGTARVRLGYAMDSFMPYLTGGLAYGSVDSKIAGAGYEPDATIANDSSDWHVDETQVGWTVGGGIDVAFTEHLSGRAEYLYVDLGETESVGHYDFSASTNFSVVRAGLNYSF